MKNKWFKFEFTNGTVYSQGYTATQLKNIEKDLGKLIRKTRV